MTTGDPTWPCGHTYFPSDTSIITTCPICTHVENWKFNPYGDIRPLSPPLNEQFTDADRLKNPNLASTLDSYFDAVLESFTKAQRASDTVSRPDKDGRAIGKSTDILEPLAVPASEFMETIPEASYAWARALRNKFKESEQASKEKQRIEDGRHWNPYPDLD